MAQLNADQLADWKITHRADPGNGEPRSREVRAVYPTRDDVLDGWTLLKDDRHKIVYMVRDDVVADIERTSQPTPAAR
jgi:hypothetical protein